MAAGSGGCPHGNPGAGEVTRRPTTMVAERQGATWSIAAAAAAGGSSSPAASRLRQGSGAATVGRQRGVEVRRCHEGEGGATTGSEPSGHWFPQMSTGG